MQSNGLTTLELLNKHLNFNIDPIITLDRLFLCVKFNQILTFDRLFFQPSEQFQGAY